MSKSNSVGTKLFVDSVKVGGLNSINGISITAETLDVTDFDNESGYRDKLPGFKEVDDMTASGFLDGDDSGQDKCGTLLDSGDVVDCEIRFPAKIGKSWYFKASVVGFVTGAEISDAITFETTLAVSGKPSIEATRSDSGGGDGGGDGDGGKP